MRQFHNGDELTTVPDRLPDERAKDETTMVIGFWVKGPKSQRPPTISGVP